MEAHVDFLVELKVAVERQDLRPWPVFWFDQLNHGVVPYKEYGYL